MGCSSVDQLNFQMKNAAPEPSPATAHKIFVRQMLFFATVLTFSAIENSYTVLADRARDADSLPLWKPMVWEFSSHLLIWLLIPVLGWWLARFPFTRESWWRSLPAHLLATVPFSLTHTGGMVLLRKATYQVVGESYDFGPFWGNWLYEYRKDFMTYGVIVSALLAFRVYGLWLDARQSKQDEVASQEARDNASPLSRLVVRKRNREFILDAGDIDRIEADGNYVLIFAAGESYRLRGSLEGLAQRLGDQQFARVHRTQVVNIERIREIQPWDHGDYRILLKDGSFVSFSRRYRKRLSQLFP
jgi:hypothetical protein